MNDLQTKTYTVKEVAKILGVGRTAVYEAISAAKISSLRLGRRIVVPRAAVAKLLGEDH